MTFIAFLRGINVSGQKKIVMTDLKDLFESQGFTEVRTYIQSGNIIFHSSELADPGEKIEKSIKDHYGWDLPVFCYTPERLRDTLGTFPFGEDHPDLKGNMTYLTLFNTEPNDPDSVNKFVRTSEKLVYSGKALWMYCPEGYGKSKLNNAFLEKKLNLKATTRNLRTIKMMVQMSEET